MTREEVIEKLNKSFNNGSINANEYIPLLSEFLEEKAKDKASALLQLVLNDPMLIGQTIDTVMRYYVDKYNICSLKKIVNGNYVHLCFLE